MAQTVTQNLFDGARKMGDEMFNAGRNAYLAGLGVVATAEEEARGLYDRLVAKGKRFEKSEDYVLGRTAHQVRELGVKVEDRFQRTMSGTLHRAGIPSRDEIRELIDRVEQLTRKVDKLGHK